MDKIYLTEMKKTLILSGNRRVVLYSMVSDLQECTSAVHFTIAVHFTSAIHFTSAVHFTSAIHFTSAVHFTLWQIKLFHVTNPILTNIGGKQSATMQSVKYVCLCILDRLPVLCT